MEKNRWYRELIASIIMHMPEENQISPDNAKRLLDNPTEMQTALLVAICWNRKMKFKKFARTRLHKKFRTWKTIKIGTFANRNELLKAVEKKYRTFGERDCLAREMKIDEKLATSPSSIDLVKVSLGDLGLDNKVPLWQVYDRAEELGLGEAHPDVGPQLMLQYRQPVGEKLLIGMKPHHLRCDCGIQIFCVSNDAQGRRLSGAEGYDYDNVTTEDGDWVFAQRTKSNKVK